MLPITKFGFWFGIAIAILLGAYTALGITVKVVYGNGEWLALALSVAFTLFFLGFAVLARYLGRK